MTSTLTRTAVALAVAASVSAGVGCSAGGDDEDNSSSSSSSSSSSTSSSSSGGSDFSVNATTNSTGDAQFSISVPGNTTKFAVIGTTSDSADQVAISQLNDQSGNDYLLPGGQTITLANELQQSIVLASVPSRRQDPAVRTGDQFTVGLSAASGTGGSASNKPATLRVISKPDSDLNNGSLTVNVVFVGDIAQASSNVSAVNAALSEMANIYRAGAGISLSFNKYNIPGPNVVSDPFNGDPVYATGSSRGVSPAVNLFIVGDIGGLGTQVLGISGGIPGPAVPSSRSGVAISLVNSAGSDGSFSDTDIRVMAETMAHECGHFVGLFHPIELRGNTSDPLPDTPDCPTADNCLDNPALIGNLMYPAPVQGADGQLVRQNQLTTDQRAVMNRYIAVD